MSEHVWIVWTALMIQKRITMVIRRKCWIMELWICWSVHGLEEDMRRRRSHVQTILQESTGPATITSIRA